MLTDEAELSTDERATALAALQRNTDHMMSLVADLILLAKLESGELHLHPQRLDLAKLVREAVANDHGNHPGVRLTAEVVDGPLLTGDPALMGQLVDTIVGVLVAGSASDADVRIRAHPEAPGWRLQVATTAADAATAERLLSTRLPHPDAPGEHRSCALALMLGRAIASRHSGELTMAMTRPGASITVTLPLRPRDV
jgi:K+-sensing histidine kinase KdpD